MAVNKAIVTGNLTRDPEKRGSGENPVLSFSVAVNDRKKQGDEWVDVPNFIDCVLFGARAKALGDILKKGMKVCIEGKLMQSTWEKDGQKHSKLEINCGEIELMTKPKEDSAKGASW